MIKFLLSFLICMFSFYATYSQCTPAGSGLNATVTAVTASCPLNGSINVSVTASAGGAPYTFTLTGPCITIPVVQSQSATSFTFTALQGNCTYTICISDAGGNIISRTATVTNTYNVLTGIAVTDSIFTTTACSKLTGVVSGGRAPYSYELFLGGTATGTPIQGPQSSNTFSSINPATQYTIRATDACGQSIIAVKTTSPPVSVIISVSEDALQSCTVIRELILLNQTFAGGAYGGQAFETNFPSDAAAAGLKFPIVISAKNNAGVLLSGYPYTLTANNTAGWGASPNGSLSSDLIWSPPVPNIPGIFPVTFSYIDACGGTASLVIPYNTEFSKAAYALTFGASADTTTCPVKNCFSFTIGGDYIKGNSYQISAYTNATATGTPLQTITYPAQTKMCGLDFGSTYYFKVHDPCLNKDTITSYTTLPPLPPFTITPTNCSTFCNGTVTTPFNYTGLGPNNVVATSGPASYGPYPKVLGATGGGMIGPGVLVIPNLPEGNYTFTFSNKCGETATGSLTVPVGSISAAPAHTLNITGCSSATITITPHITTTGQMLAYHTTPGCHSAAGVAYYSNIIFTYISPSGGPIAGSGNITVNNPSDSYTANVTAPGTYVAKISYSQGLPGLNNAVSSCYQLVTDTFNVAFTNIPTIVRVYTLPCVAGSYSIVPVAPNAAPGTQYTLYASNGTTVLAGPQTGNTFSNITTTAGSNLVIKAQDLCGQVSTVPFTVTTSTSIAGSVTCTTALVAGVSVAGDSLRADFINGATYLWTAPNGTTFTGPNPPFVVPSQSGTWTLATTIQSGPCNAVLTNSFTTTSCEFGPPPPPPPPPSTVNDPIQLTASVNLCKVRLDWTTITEVNSLRFDVEESTDNVNWNVVATVTAAGNSTTPKNYTVTLTPLTSHVYYRIKQTDTDGHIKYSNFVDVNTVCPTTSGTDILILPNNPSATGTAITLNFFSSAQRGDALLIFVDAIGRQYLKQPVVITAGMNYFHLIPPQYLAKGTYFISLVTYNTRWRSNTVKVVLIK